MKKWKKFLSALLLVGQLTSLTGCVTTPKDTSDASVAESTGEVDYNAEVEYTIWALATNDDSKATFNEAVERVKKKFPNVTLQVEEDPQDGDVKIKTMAAAGTMPDFYVTNNSLVQLFKRSNNNQSLDKWLNETGLIEQLDPEKIKDIVDPYDGKIYAVNRPSGPLEFVANKKVFDKLGLEIPTNYDEFLHVVEVCRKNDILPMALSFKEGFQCAQLFECMLTRDKISLWDIDKGDMKTSEEAFTTAANKMKALIDSGFYSPSAFTMTEQDALTAFESGQAAMFMASGLYHIISLDREMNSSDLVLMGYPWQEAGKPLDKSLRAGGNDRNTGYTVSPSAEQLDVAGTWLSYFSLELADLEYARGMCMKVTTNDVPLSDTVGELAKSFANQDFEMLTPMPWAWDHGESYAVLCEQCNKFFTGDYATEDFLKNMQSEMDEVLSSK